MQCPVGRLPGGDMVMALGALCRPAPRVWHGNVRMRSVRRREEVPPVTVTIGAICSVNSQLQTGSIVLCADTLISYAAWNGTPISSNPSGGKLFDLPLGFFAAVSGDIARCNQVVSYLHQRMKQIPSDRQDRIELLEAAIRDTSEYLLLKVRQEVLVRYGVTLEEFLQNSDLPNRAEIREEIKQGIATAGVLIAGFSFGGCPTLLHTDCASIRSDTRFICDGSGGQAALDWLNMREQSVFMSVPRTVYHVHEAKRFAERSPVVGTRHQMLLLRHDRPAVSVGGDRQIVHEWLSRYRPQNTAALDSAEAYADFAKAYDISDSTSSSGDHT